MSKLFFDKKGDEKIFSIWWVGMMLIVGAGIVFTTLTFYSAYSDINAIESEIIAKKIEICINLGAEGFGEEGFNLLTSCGFSAEIFETSGYFLQVSIDGGRKYIYGNQDFEAQCELRKGLRKAANFADCSEREFYFQGKKLKVIAGSNSYGKVVK